jgi:hypothetical protein
LVFGGNEKREFLISYKEGDELFSPAHHHSLTGVLRIEWIFIIPVHDFQA